MKQIIAGLTALVGACVIGVIVEGGVTASAHDQGSSSGPIVASSVQGDVSPPLREIKPKHHDPTLHQHPLRVSGGGTSGGGDPALQTLNGPLVSALSGLNFAGVGNGDYGFVPNAAPPDTEGAVGATQYVQWVNESFAIFDKATGALLYGPAAGNTHWTGFGGGCENNNDGDPIVQYDKLNGRWIFLQFSVSTSPYLWCVAVSQTSDATGLYNRYAFNQGNRFPDYTKLGVWPDAYYVTANTFNNGQSFAGPMACAWDGAGMRAAAPSVLEICFQINSSSIHSLLPSDIDGVAAPPVGEKNLLARITTGGALQFFQFHVDFITPNNSTLSGPTSVGVASYTQACFGGTCVPQPGTSQKLDSLADRAMYRFAYRNFGGYESWLLNHSVATSFSRRSASGSGIRWYELRNGNPVGTAFGSVPKVYQQGTFAPDSIYRWMGSIAQDKNGDILVGYSVSSGSVFPGIRVTGRVPGDPLGTLESETTIQPGGGSQVGFNLSRWGDYSAMSVDPVNDCTFFYTSEYLKASGAFNWSTRIATYRFPSCN